MNLIANRFEVTRTLGEGAEGVAYLARDRADGGKTVVVKVSNDAASGHESEIELVGDLRHPNLAELIHAGQTAPGDPFVVYAYAPGAPITEVVGTEAQWRCRLAHALRALAFLHARGLVHGDLSPENVRVDDRGAVRLIDFGLAGRIGDESAGGGTPPYIAPEARGDSKICAADDVFSLGAVACHAITGRPPFVLSEGGVIEYGALEPLESYGVSSAFASWLHGLLAPVEARPADARAALVALRALDDTVELETIDTRRAYVRSAPMIARESELRSLTTLFDRPENDTEEAPPVGLVYGAAGSGKTKLFDVAMRRVSRAAHTVRCAGYAELAPPYALLRDLLTQIDRLVPVGEEPALSDLLVEPDAGPSTAAHEPNEALRRHERVTRALCRRAAQQRITILVDDVHRADAASIECLGYLVRSIALASPRPALTVIASSTTDAADRIGPLASELHEHGGRLISLAPLDKSETARLIRTLLADPDLDDETVTWAHRRTRGNPLFIGELLDAMANRLVVPTDELGVRLVLDEEMRSAIPPTLAGLLSRRIHGLSDDQRRVLAGLCVFLEPATLPVVAETVSCSIDRVQPALEALVANRLVARDAASGRYGAGDRATRTVALQTLSNDERVALHASAGDVLLRSRTPGDLPEIATHFLAADPSGRGRRFAEEAAEWSAGISALPRAIDLYRAALDATPDDASADRSRIRRQLADAYLSTGRATDAVALLAPHWPGDDQTGRLRQLGDAHYAVGDHAAAATCYRIARHRMADAPAAERLALTLRRARVANDRGRPTAAVRLSRFALVWRGPLDRDDPLWRSTLAELHSRLADLRFNRGEFELASRHAEHALTHAGDDKITSAALFNLMGNIGLRTAALDDARTRYDRALELREEFGDLRGMASTLNNLAMLAGRRGRLGEAAHSFRRAITLQARIGDHRGRALTLNNLARLYCVDAKFDRAIDAFQQSLEVAQSLGDGQTEAMIHANLGAIAAIRGEIGPSITHRLASIRLRRGLRTPGRMDDTLLSLGDMLLEMGDLERAGRMFRRTAERASTAGRPLPALRARIGLARVASARGDDARAIRALDALDAGTDALTGAPEVELLTALAQAQLGDGRLDDAAASVERCRARVAAQPSDFESADRCCLLEARIALERGNAGAEVTTAVRDVFERAEGLNARVLAIDATVVLGQLAAAAGDAAEAVAHYARGADLVERVAATIDSSRLCRHFFSSARTIALETAAAGLRERTYLESPDPTVRDTGVLQALKANLFDVERTLDFTKTRFDKQNAGLKRVLQIAEQMSSTFETDGLFALMLDSVMELTGAERGFVILRDSDRDDDLRVAAARTNDKHDLPAPEAQISRSVVRRVLDQCRPIVLRDAAGDDILEHSHSVLRLDLRSIMCTPLGSGRDASGVLYVENRTQSDRFGDDDLELLEIFAHQAAVALHNAELFRDLNHSLHDLREAQDRLIRQEKLRVMGEVASGVLHNLKNLLTPLLGTAQLMMADARNSHAFDDLKTVERLTLECSQVIRRFSNFAQGRSGLDDVTAVSLHDLIEEVSMLVKPRWDGDARKKKIQLSVHNRVPADTFARGDAAQLREVFINLIYNAADAMPQGGDIVVTAARNGSEVHTTVIDTGIGMSEDVRRKIFDPFFTTKGRDGMGVGMSVTDLIVQQHGGHIDVESAPNEGTRMTIVLPRVEPPDSDEPPEPQPRTSVLVVDDDPAVRSVLSRSLEQDGFAVTSADRAEEAERLLSEGLSPAVVVTDLRMPGANGLQLAAAVKRRTPDVPVILVTGHAATLAARPRNIDALLEKPVAMVDFVDTVRRAALSRAPST